MSIPGKMMKIGGYNYHVGDVGEGDKVVMLVHGMPDDGSCWKYQVPALVNAGYRVDVTEGQGWFGGWLGRYFGLFLDDWVATDFEQGLAAFRKTDWKDGLDFFESVLKIDPEDGPSRLYRERVLECMKNPPPKDWDGVFTFLVK